MMANLTILDTGVISDLADSRLSSADMANSGVAFELKGVRFNFVQSVNWQDDPDIGTFNWSEINMVTMENATFTLTGVLDMNNATDKTMPFPLLRLVQTKGLKCLYYSNISTTAGADEQLVTALAKDITTGTSRTFTTAEQTKYSLSFNYAYIKVRFKEISFEHDATNYKRVTYQMTGVVL